MSAIMISSSPASPTPYDSETTTATGQNVENTWPWKMRIGRTKVKVQTASSAVNQVEAAVGPIKANYSAVEDDEDLTWKPDPALPPIRAPHHTLNTRQTRSHPLTPINHKESRFDQFAVALKTSHDTAASRASIQLVTFLSHIRHKILIGDFPNEYLGPTPIIDVITNLYNETEAILKQKQLQNTTLRSFAKRSLPDQVTWADNTPGWAADAHKNLPGFQILHARFPDAKWYLMIDDDTFVFMDNLADMVKSLNHTHEYYIGNGNVFNGCDGVEKFGDGPEFAHGGSGILISSGAMKKMVKGVEKCIIKYRDCWAGDIRTSLCLRDHNILIKGGDGFSGDPPNTRYGFPDDPCSRPITFHHVVPHQIQSLYHLSLLAHAHHPTHGITYSDVHNHLFHTSGPQRGDRGGKELEGSGGDVASVDECERRCREYAGTGRCWSWVSNGKRCWLKEGIEDVRERDGFWTGTVARVYKCDRV
ncbi:hypothetical protein BC829DRAFT_419726 [Chytridium lagenaria]|nr:hypothetical protein BC829DRAFT_419726 [Chytridium lagenaria]